MSRMLLAALTLALCAAPPGHAAQAPASPTSVPPPVATSLSAAQSVVATPAKSESHALTVDDLRTFLDGFVPYALHRGDIAGATVAVVKDGRIFFAQGYGYADLKTKKPVVADETLFRPGSISKLFTWTSVMQLVEEGKLDLDRNVNDYLDFKVPDKFGKPITLRNIMTHTSGFEETTGELFVDQPSQLYPLGKYLQKHMPERIFPPGKIVAYSNFATALAGYIVQRVSGEEFSDYVQNHIFTPLGMTHSSFKDPLPPALARDMATGYMQASEAKPVPYENVEAAPAGALASTATDMARFMIAQLGDGSLDGARILKPQTIEEMHSRNYTLAPKLLNGMDLGFYQENRNGHRIIGHAGDTEAFHSDLHLILDAHTGIFMSFNSAGKNGEVETVRVALFRAFLDRYFPYLPPEENTVPDMTAKADAARVAGSYIASRREDTALKLFFHLSQTDVTALPDGRITVSAFKDFSGSEKKWREIAPLYYREVGGQTHLEFVTDPEGGIAYFASDDFLPVELFQRVHGLEQSQFLKLFGIGTIVVSLLTLVIEFGGFIVRRRFGRPLEMELWQRRLRAASRFGAAVFVAIVAGWIGVIVVVTVKESLLLNGSLTPLFGMLYCLGALGVVGGIAMIANAVSRVVTGPGAWLARASEILVGLAGLYGIWAIIDYGLANFNFNF